MVVDRVRGHCHVELSTSCDIACSSVLLRRGYPAAGAVVLHNTKPGQPHIEAIRVRAGRCRLPVIEVALAQVALLVVHTAT